MNQEEKKCPQCAELVKFEAKICRFCQYNFEEQSGSKKEKQHVRAHSGISDGIKLSAGRTLYKIGFWIVGLIILMMIMKSNFG